MTDPQPSTSGDGNVAQSFSAGRLGGDGEEYQRLFALMLIQRASRKRIAFDLAFEHKALSKFEDVVLHVEEPGQWWLFQNKHRKQKSQSDRTKKSLLSLSYDNELALFQYIEGYQNVVNNWKHGKHKKWFCVFTNGRFREENGLQEEFTFEGEVKKVIIFNCGKFIQFKGLESAMFEKINKDFYKIVLAVHMMFEEGFIENVIYNYKEVLLPIIHATESVVKFSQNFPENKLEEDLCYALMQFYNYPDIREVLSTAKNVLDFWNNQTATPEKKRKTKIPSYTSMETIEEFFKDFILAHSQPDLDELEMLMSEESRLWMRDWIRPDDFGRFSNDQIGNFFRTFKKEFTNWEKPVQNNKSFLRLCDGNTYLKQAEKILRNEVEKCANRSCVSFEQIEGYYINRQLKCQLKCIKDVFIIDQLPKNEEQFYAVTAEPGMGKSTLMQYLAYNVQRKYSDVAVFLLYSSNFHGTIPSVEQLEDISNENVFKSFLSPENIHLIVKDDKTKINLFIDALDELSDVNQYQILKLIKVLLTKKNLKIVVSCRNHVLDKLSNNFCVKPLEIQAFTEDEQKQFFIKVWKDISNNKDKLESFSNKLIQKINNDIDCNTNQFTSLPLTIKMVTEIHSASYKKYCKFRKSVETFFQQNEFNVVVLFENITSKCIKIAINKKCKVDNNAELDPFFDSTHKAIDNDYQIFAAKCLFANNIELIPFIANEFFGSVEGSITEQQSLLVEIQSGSPEFTHKSYREYFAAKFLFEYVGKKPIIYCISEILEVLIKHKIMRNFFFGLMYSITKNDMNRLKFLSNLDQVVLLWSCDDDNVFQNQSLLNQSKDSIVQKICDYLVSKIKCKSDADESIAKTSDTKKPLIQKIKKAKQNSFKKKEFWSKYKEMIHLPKSPKIEQNIVFKNSSIFHAAFFGCLRSVNILVESSVNVNSEDSEKNTALHFSAREGHKHIVEYLINKGAQSNVQNSNGKSPLMLALEQGHHAIVSILKEHSAKPDLRLLQTMLRESVMKNQENVLKSLIEVGAEVNSQDEKTGKTLFHLHLVQNDTFPKPNIIKLLIEAGAIVEKFDNEGNSPLHHASKFEAIFPLFINHCCKINRYNSNKDTPLHLALKAKKSFVARLLLFKQACIHLTSTNGNTALHLALGNNLPDVANILIDLGSDVNSQNSKGETPLHLAAINGNLGVARRLIENEASVTTRTKEEKTVLDYVDQGEIRANIRRLLIKLIETKMSK